MKRFLYFYLMRNRPDDIRRAAPAHAQYWRERNLPGYMGGPFADRSGGLITFEAAGIEEAKQAVMSDPFVLDNLIEQSWVREWRVE
jgi:uncharacterized protein YciI